MNILLIGTDRTALDPESSLGRRLNSYKGIVNNLDVIIPHNRGRVGALLEIKRRAEEHLRENRVDVISTRDIYFLGFVAARLARRFDVALEIQVHGIEKMSPFRKMLARLVFIKADSIRVVSKRMKNMLTCEFNVPQSEITVAPIYTNWESLQNTPPAFDLHTRYPNKFIFLTVGRLVPIKNISMQIEAMKEIGDGAVLIIIGDGEDRKSLERKAGDNVVFIGKTDDTASYYKGADCMLLTSDYEGWGLVAVEAASVGLPIIMTDVGLANEIIMNNDYTRVIPVGDIGALITNMRAMISRGKQTHVPFEDVHKRLMSRKETLQMIKRSWGIAVQNHGRH